MMAVEKTISDHDYDLLRQGHVWQLSSEMRTALFNQGDLNVHTMVDCPACNGQGSLTHQSDYTCSEFAPCSGCNSGVEACPRCHCQGKLAYGQLSQIERQQPARQPSST